MLLFTKLQCWHYLFALLIWSNEYALSFTPSLMRPVHTYNNRLSTLYARRGAFGRHEMGARQQRKAPPAPINENIRHDPIRLIVPREDGEPGEEEMLGVYALNEALEKAESYDLDLVLINENADPPVCKIVDYGKHKYILERKKKETARKQVKKDTKEVKMSYKIDQHDFDVRVRAVQRFLTAGERVKVLVQFKGREMQHTQLGRELLQKVYEPLQEIAAMDGPPKMEGRAMSMFVSPKKP